MDITKDLIESLSSDDLDNILIYKELLEEAKEATRIIKSFYKFSIGEDKITVWSDSCNAEYLTHSGVWMARYLNQTYDVSVNVDSIFKVYKEKYNASKIHSCRVNNVEDSAGYFRSFVRATEEKLNEL
jgi:hypothetical protein